MSCSAPSFLKQTAWPKPHSHTLCHLGKPQPSAGQCDPLQNQWEVWGAPGCGAQRPTSWVGHCLNKLVGNTESGHQFTPKGVKHIVMARGRRLSLFNTLAMNILPMLGTLLNERKRRHARQPWAMSLLWPGFFPCSAAKTCAEALYV